MEFGVKAVCVQRFTLPCRTLKNEMLFIINCMHMHDTSITCSLTSWPTIMPLTHLDLQTICAQVEAQKSTYVWKELKDQGRSSDIKMIYKYTPGL